MKSDNDIGQVSHYQILLPKQQKQLLNELLHALHGPKANYLGITKIIQEARQKIRSTIVSKPHKKLGTKLPNVHTKQKNDKPKSGLLNCSEWDLCPDDILQMGILPNFPPSGGFDNKITAFDVFSRSLFAYPTTRLPAPAVTRYIMDKLFEHTYLPTSIKTDMGTHFN